MSLEPEDDALPPMHSSTFDVDELIYEEPRKSPYVSGTKLVFMKTATHQTPSFQIGLDPMDQKNLPFALWEPRIWGDQEDSGGSDKINIDVSIPDKRTLDFFKQWDEKNIDAITAASEDIFGKKKTRETVADAYASVVKEKRNGGEFVRFKMIIDSEKNTKLGVTPVNVCKMTVDESDVPTGGFKRATYSSISQNSPLQIIGECTSLRLIGTGKIYATLMAREILFYPPPQKALRVRGPEAFSLPSGFILKEEEEEDV